MSSPVGRWMRVEQMAQSAKNDPLIKEIRKKGWRQGSIITAEQNKVNSPEQVGLFLNDCTHWLLLSHDCDIVHHDFENEPHVEIMAARFVDSSDGNLLHGKNPRCLQVKMGEQWIEFHVGSRRLIERRHLAYLVPDSGITLQRDAVQSLAGWVARRYVRTAFPDSFNKRLQGRDQQIKKLMSNEGGNICTIYLLLSDEIELPDEEVYRIDVVAAMRDEDYNHPQKRVPVETTLGKLCGLLNSCAGIKTEKSEVRAERDISLTDIRFLRRLEFDYLSRNESDAPPSLRP